LLPTPAHPILPSFPTRRSSDLHRALETAARLIEAASFPLIFAGNGVIRGRASDELRALAHGHGIPVVHTFMAKGSMPYDDDLCQDRKSTRLNSSHVSISYAVFC